MEQREIRRALKHARIEAQSALEDYIQGIHNAPHTSLAQALMRARAYNTLLLVDPTDEHALQLLRDVNANEHYTRRL